MKLLVVFDVDQTVCDSREYDHLIKDLDDVSVWIDAIIADPDLNAVPGVKAAVAKLANTDPGTDFLFLTGRSKTTWAATYKWLCKTFPDIRPRISLSTRIAPDHATNFISKSHRFENHWWSYKKHYDGFVMADDDLDMKAMADKHGGKFYHVKNCAWESDWEKYLLTDSTSK